MEKNSDGSYTHRGYLVTSWVGVWTVNSGGKPLAHFDALGEAREWINRQFDR